MQAVFLCFAFLALQAISAVLFFTYGFLRSKAMYFWCYGILCGFCLFLHLARPYLNNHPHTIGLLAANLAV